MTPEDTVEYWLGRYRAEGADSQNLHGFLTTVDPDIPQAIAARQYIAELEQAQRDHDVALAHAESRPEREQSERHHIETLTQSRRQAKRAEFVAWAAVLISVVALLLPWIQQRRGRAHDSTLRALAQTRARSADRPPTRRTKTPRPQLRPKGMCGR